MADTKKIINCPACDCEMKKIVVPEVNTCIDICIDGCGGIFFDNRELEKFDEPHENADEILKAVEGRTFKSVDTEGVRSCPVCGIQMTKMGAANGNVEIDVCNQCGGKFLDNGELQKIRNGAPNDVKNLEDVFNDIYEINLHEVVGKKYAGNLPKSSPRRQFFEDLARIFI